MSAALLGAGVHASSPLQCMPLSKLRQNKSCRSGACLPVVLLGDALLGAVLQQGHWTTLFTMQRCSGAPAAVAPKSWWELQHRVFLANRLCGLRLQDLLGAVLDGC